MLKSDIWIREMGYRGMIEPFEPTLVRKVGDLPVLSYGCSSYGYDLRLSPKDFRIFRHVPGLIVDPKNFNPKSLGPAELHSDETGQFFIIPGHSYGLGVTLERIRVPRSITIIFLGKSTYARMGAIANVTPGESEWEGHLTIEISNSSPADIKVYANEGILQALFFEGGQCDITYSDRQGKYQCQGHEVTLPRI